MDPVDKADLAAVVLAGREDPAARAAQAMGAPRTSRHPMRGAGWIRDSSTI
jgi:hypothetical protein